MIPKLRIMRRQTAHTQRRPRRGGALGLAAAILAALALAPATAAATAGEPLISEGAAWKVGGEIIVGADINPEGLETNYEILLECPDHEICQTTEGTLPAFDEARAVRLTLTAPQAGATYLFTVNARNADGKTSASWRFQAPSLPSQEIPPGAAPNGRLDTESYTPPELPWTDEAGAEIAARAVAEQRAIEHEEQQAKEAAASRAAEAEALKRREEEEAQQAAARRREEIEHPACIVPALMGDTLVAARRALAKAHCRLGAVHRPSHLHLGTLCVSAQGAPAGRRLTHASRVALWVGVKRASRREKGRR
jgi:hypothetical protein